MYGYGKQEIPDPFAVFAQKDLPGVSTNLMAHWRLNAILRLKLIGDMLKED